MICPAEDSRQNAMAPADPRPSWTWRSARPRSAWPARRRTCPGEPGGNGGKFAAIAGGAAGREDLEGPSLFHPVVDRYPEGVVRQEGDRREGPIRISSPGWTVIPREVSAPGRGTAAGTEIAEPPKTRPIPL